MITRSRGLWMRWSWRHLRRRWALSAAIALIIALGTGTYAGLGGTTGWRIASNDASYAALGMHDVEATLPDGSYVDVGRLTAALATAAHPEWIAAAEERLVVPTQLDASHGGRTVLAPGQLVGLPDSATVDTLHLTTGTGWPSSPASTGAGPAAESERPVAVVQTGFARANDLPVSGTLVLAGGTELAYTGHGVTPDYFFVLGADLSTDATFGVLFVPLGTAQRVSGLGEKVNDLVLRFTADADRTAALAEVRSALASVGAEVEAKEDNASYRALYEDARNDQETWNFFALLILAGAGFASFNLISRMVEAERRELGVGMAIGAPPWVLPPVTSWWGFRSLPWGRWPGSG